jgi:hypothetical protein
MLVRLVQRSKALSRMRVTPFPIVIDLTQQGSAKFYRVLLIG